jgi:replicative DNA helicase
MEEVSMNPNDPCISLDDELGFIGCCLQGREVALEAFSLARREVFSSEVAILGYDLIETLITENKDTTQIDFARKWRETHKFQMPMELLTCQDGAYASKLRFYVEGLQDAYRRRKVLEAGNVLTMNARDIHKTPAEIVALAENIIADSDAHPVSSIDSKTAATWAAGDYVARIELQGALSGIETPFSKLNQLTNGLQYGEQNIIGARPSIGKTAIGLNIFSHAIFEVKVPSLFISLEMSIQALSRRMGAAKARVSLAGIKSGSLSDQDSWKYKGFLDEMEQSPAYFVDGTRGMDGFEAANIITKHAQRYGVKLVVLDYIQKLRAPRGGKSEKKTYEIEENSFALKSAAHRNKVALISLAQLSREAEGDKERMPRLSDLSDSKSLENDADVVGLLHRKRGEAETCLLIAKQRDGELGPVPLTFLGQYGLFVDRSPISDNDVPT